jgi:large subunit ribosomal protein L19
MSLKFKHQNTIASIGDTIRVHQEITEGESKRTQIFEGILIAVKNRGRNKTFTVRKIGANNIGVEKIFPVYLPSIKKIEVKRHGKARRSKLYYLREKQGKAASRVKEKKEYDEKKADSKKAK